MAEETKKVSELELKKIKNGEITIQDIDIQYKEVFFISNIQEQLDLVKNVIALANSKGGYIIYGVNSNNDWIGLDDRSDDKIIYTELVDLFESYISAPVDIVFNLLEIDKSFYFVLFVGENKTEEALCTSKSGFYSIKNWGSKVEKKVYSFEKGDIFIRENNQTTTDTTGIYKVNKLQAVTSKSQTDTATNYIENNAGKSSNEIINSLPDSITQKIEKIYTLEKSLKDLNLKLDTQDSIPVLHANINRINKTITEFNDDLNSKKISEIKYADNLVQLDLLEKENKTLEEDFYELMSIKNKTPFDKTFNLDGVKINLAVKTSLMDLYKHSHNQFQYNWGKKLEELSTGLVATINNNKREISNLKEYIKNYEPGETEFIQNLIEGQQDILSQEQNRIAEINSLISQIAVIQDEILELKQNVTSESTNYLKDLVFNKLNKVDFEVKKDIWCNGSTQW